MGKKAMENLTEPMFYILLAFLQGPMCGQDASAFIDRRTRGRVRIGPGTLYTILGKFEKEKLLEEIEVDGRKRTYRITEKGRALFEGELQRLRQCLLDAEKEENA